LVLAIVQVRFPLIAHLQTLEGIAPVQDLLRGTFPYLELEQTQQVSVTFGQPDPLQGMGISNQWVFTDDKGTKLMIGAGGATLTAGDEYEGIKVFASQFEQVLTALSKAEGIPRCDRLGVRFLDIAEPPPADPSAWQRWFRPELIGWVGAGVLDSQTRLVSALASTNLSCTASALTPPGPGDVQGQVRHGYVPAATTIADLNIEVQQPAFLLDMDLFIQAPQAFDPSILTAQFVALQREMAGFFQWSLTAEGKDYFGLAEVEAE
jgi:uncharacterized protein (TIGR04255 family)